MATSVGEIGLDLVVNSGQFSRQMAGIQSLAKKAAIGLAAAFSVKKIVEFGKSCIDLGSDLAEVQNVVDSTFPSMSAQIDRFSQSAATSFGLSETMAKRYVGTFGAMSKSFGFTEESAYNMSTALTGLAGDVASFYNISQDEAYTKLKSVFTGETESLKELGVVMTQTALDQFALANGFGKTTAKMSEAEKVALRYQFVQSKLATATGDFARTSSGWANQVRVFSLQIESLKANLGQGLINLFAPVLQVVNALIVRLVTLAKAFKAFSELITKKKSGGGIENVGKDANTATNGLNNTTEAADNLSKSTKGVEDSAKKAAKAMRSLMGFDKINRLDKKEDASSQNAGNATPTIGAAPAIENMDFGNLAEGENEVDRLSKKFEKLFSDISSLCEPAISSLKRLWNEGLKELGQFGWDALKGFYDNFLVPIGTWVMGEGLPRFIDALNSGLMAIDYDKINTALNNLWDALTPFAINIGEGLLWFWENVLVPLGTWTANEVVPRFLETLAHAIDILNAILEALSPLWDWFWKNVLLPIAQWTGGVFLTIWDSINNALGSFADWCSNNPGTIQTAAVVIGAFFAAWKITEMLAFIQQSGGIISTIGMLTTAIGGATTAKLMDKAETLILTAMYAKDFVVSIGQSVTALGMQAGQFALSTAAKVADTIAQVAMTAATVAWNAVCAIATTLTAALGAAIAFLTSPIGIAIAAIVAIIAAGVLLYKHWDTVKEKASQCWDFIKNVFKKFDNWLGNVFSTDFSKKFGKIGEIMNVFRDDAKAIWEAVKKVFEGVGEFISGVFTGNWKKAWGGIKKIFSGIWDGIVGVMKKRINVIIKCVESMINFVSRGINAMIGGLNRLHFEVPDWVPVLGGKTLGFNIPKVGEVKIPRLATGAYVRANTPQLAMIGDNMHQGEFVAPKDMLAQTVVEAVKSVSTGNNAVTREELESMLNRAVMRIVAALASLGFNVDGKLLAQAQQSAQNALNMQYNVVDIK